MYVCMLFIPIHVYTYSCTYNHISGFVYAHIAYANVYVFLYNLSHRLPCAMDTSHSIELRWEECEPTDC